MGRIQVYAAIGALFALLGAALYMQVRKVGTLEAELSQSREMHSELVQEVEKAEKASEAAIVARRAAQARADKAGRELKEALEHASKNSVCLGDTLPDSIIDRLPAANGDPVSVPAD